MDLRRVYVRPLCIAPTADIGRAWRRLADGRLGFGAVQVIVRPADRPAWRMTVALADLEDNRAGLPPDLFEPIATALERLTRPRPPVAGLDWTRPRIMGVVNVTPDSFSDGGRFDTLEAAVAQGCRLAAEGADLIDVGGESTRPGATPVDAEEETRRVVPVIRALAARGLKVSIDSRRAAVIAAGLAAGASLVNDVSALAGDPASPEVVAKAGVPVVLMHMQGDPRTMQNDPRYDDVLLDVHDRLAERLDACRRAGIPDDRLIVDPGIGFGKTVAHNVALLQGLSIFHDLGVPVLLGASRKSFIAALSRGEPPGARLGGSLAAVLTAFGQGVQIVRVHDGAETGQARAVWEALVPPAPTPDAAATG